MRNYLVVILLVAACSGAQGTGNPVADYKSYTKVSTEPFVSPTHGGRFVEIWVNKVGVAAYQSEAEFPVGTVIVKESWEKDANGGRTAARGPLFIMQKREKGYDSDNNDWYYALHWDDIPDNWVAKMGGAKSVHWESPSKKVSYCYECHENYDREVGLPAKGYRTWEQASK